MVRARDVLDRFRPVGGPGAATAAGVPADRQAEVAHELEPVLALLDDVVDECTRLQEQAERDARQIRDAGAVHVARIQAEAREHARAARAEQAALAQQQAEQQHAQALAAGTREAAEVLALAASRRQALVDRAVSSLRSTDAATGPPS